MEKLGPVVRSGEGRRSARLYPWDRWTGPESLTQAGDLQLNVSLQQWKHPAAALSLPTSEAQ